MRPEARNVLIVGAGVCGLWLAQALTKAGWRCQIWEQETPGAQQSGASQGILHSGLKYQISAGSQGSNMPELVRRWQAAWRAEGEIDLSQARVLTQEHYYFFSSKLASLALRAMTRRLLASGARVASASERPPLLARLHSSALIADEWVLDIPSLLHSLSHGLDIRQRQLQAQQLKRQPDGNYGLAPDEQFQPRYIILCAGAANASLQKRYQQQLRPLAMLHLRHQSLPQFFGHCLQFGSKPALTIGSPEPGYWYVGGGIAEWGSRHSEAAIQNRSRKLLARLFPQLPWRNVAISVSRVDRAEAAQQSGGLPDQAFVGADANLITCWPTKLVRAPEVADRVMQLLGV